MTPRQRFLAHMRFQEVDRPPRFESGPWGSTVERWSAESGLSAEQVLAFLGECDERAGTGVSFAMLPPLPEAVVAEDAETVTRRDGMGQLLREFRNDPSRSMPEFVDFPVHNWADWREIRHRFDPNHPDRYPADWSARVARWQQRQPVLNLYGFVANYFGGPSLFGFVRMLMGPERALYAFHDEPDLVHDMMEVMTEFTLEVLPRALREAPVSMVQFWEDMCFRSGPLISPRTVREFMLPRYRRICDLVRQAGVDVIFLDSDGDVQELIPLWLEAGINGVFPMEQAAGNDLPGYRRRYGRNLLLMGGVDKRALARGRAEIDRELERLVPLARGGGFIPTIDHAIPPDVSWANFQYYWARRKALLG